MSDIGVLSVASSGTGEACRVAIVILEGRQREALFVSYDPAVQEWMAGRLLLTGRLDGADFSVQTEIATPPPAALDAIRQAVLDLAGVKPARDGGVVVAGGDA